MNLTIDPSQAPAAAAALADDILPAIRAAEGFVAGYWLEPVDGRGFAVILCETELQVRDAVVPMTDSDAPGVTILDIDFRRVAVATSADSA